MFCIFWDNQYTVLSKKNHRWYINNTKIKCSHPKSSHDTLFYHKYSQLYSIQRASVYLWCDYNLEYILNTDSFIVCRHIRDLLLRIIFDKYTFLFPCVYISTTTGSLSFWNDFKNDCNSFPVSFYNISMNYRLLDFDIHGYLQTDSPLPKWKPFTRDIRTPHSFSTRKLFLRIGCDSIWSSNIEYRLVRIDHISLSIFNHPEYGNISFSSWKNGIYFHTTDTNTLTLQLLKVGNHRISIPPNLNVLDTISKHITNQNQTLIWDTYFNNVKIKKCVIPNCNHVVLPPNSHCIIHNNICKDTIETTTTDLHQCNYIIRIGSKKGTQCPKMIRDNEYCKLHQHKEKHKFKIRLIRKKQKDGTLYWIINDTNFVTFHKKEKVVSGYINDQGHLISDITDDIRQKCMQLGIKLKIE
jgi:hypothetical protein